MSEEILKFPEKGPARERDGAAGAAEARPGDVVADSENFREKGGGR